MHPTNRPQVRGVVRELFETALFVLLVFLIVRGVVQNFKIEGQSMEPNLHTSQFILVNKIGYFHFDTNAPMRLLTGNAKLPPNIVYPFHMPQRDDIVVFEYPPRLPQRLYQTGDWPARRPDSGQRWPRVCE